jgi:hypothetical protein
MFDYSSNMKSIFFLPKLCDLIKNKAFFVLNRDLENLKEAKN